MSAAPVAVVMSIDGAFVHVRCPYCGDIHAHKVGSRGHTERRAPACGVYAPLTPDARALGYTFTTPAPVPGQTRRRSQ